ncbi:putative glycine dehydrogenase (decarboxylating) subunit 1 [Symmachiella dynata]|uniref:Probable glycine dehydrogenase (decarboxylating) subunit 1 n=1 Tax=Symmachiella dynata TaxID=2527995 RepID=A0A517ZNT4_9PLAN|nr:aminomethyl-transferring glycine dehydrogenase subunit GcvPA [Symmachiella dynata]QDU44144.1 putative glycine dehydrogenase (decarboxylating) subunit 1 [Symmachiella dynata]
MAYLDNTPEQQREMLATIGAASIEELFAQIPAELQLKRPLDMPPALSEMELQTALGNLAKQNSQRQGTCFLGGGCYDHFIPAAVDAIASRSEFYTAYTPYQAEASQGSLQAFYEFQTLVCQLTGMEVSNASLYEGGTSVSEAAFMAMRVTGRYKKVVLLGSVHPEYRAVVDTYFSDLDSEAVVVPTPNGTADLAAVRDALDDQTACLVIQQPNFFGCLEDARELVEAAHEVGALAVVSCDPISLGMLVRPGEYGADIVVAEGQSLGTPLQYGGPFLGILACRQKFMRKMPGRLIGETTDRDGRPCFVLNLQAREQHIRRDKATSNICTNQGLIALRATAYMALLGKQGLGEVAELSCRKAHYVAERLTAIDGFSLAYDRPYFKEFTLRCENGAAEALDKAAQAGFDIGPLLSQFDASNQSDLLVATTECRTRQEIDALADALAQ